MTVLEIIEDNTYTGDLAVEGDLTVSTSLTAYGAITVGGTLDSGDIFLNGGSIAVGATTPMGTTPLTTSLLDMVDGATLTVSGEGNIFLAIDTLTMGTGTTFEVANDSLNVTVDGDIGCSGTVSVAAGSSLTVTGDYNQALGDLILNNCGLTIEGDIASLSGHTLIEGTVGISGDSNQIDGAGLMELSAGGVLNIAGDLEIRSGTFDFDDISGSVNITGDLKVFIGTLDMNVGFDGEGRTLSNKFNVSGSADIGTDEGGPTLNLNQVGSGTSPTTFTLIVCDTGTGDFNTITADSTVTFHGFATIAPNDLYLVTL